MLDSMRPACRQSGLRVNRAFVALPRGFVYTDLHIGVVAHALVDLSASRRIPLGTSCTGKSSERVAGKGVAAPLASSLAPGSGAG